MPPARVGAHVGFEGVVGPRDGADEGAPAHENRIDRRLLQHLLPVERRHRHAHRLRVHPARRNGLIGVVLERFFPRERVDDTGPGLPGQRPDRRLDHPGLLHRIGCPRERAVGQRALQPLEGPRRRGLLAQEASLVVEQPGAQLHRLTGLEHHLGGGHLQMRGRALPRLRRLVHGQARGGARLS